MAERDAVQGRSKGYTQEATIAGLRVVLTTNEWDDGRLESFRLHIDKQSSFQIALLQSFCDSVAMGLEAGVPLATYVDEYLLSRFEPSGQVVGNERIKQCTSLLDYAFREIGISYLGRDDLAQTSTASETSRKSTSLSDEALQIQVSNVVLRKADDLAVLCSLLLEQIAEYVSDLHASTPNEPAALEIHQRVVSSISSLSQMVNETRVDLVAVARRQAPEAAISSSKKIITLQSLFTRLVTDNPDLPGTTIRVSVAAGFIGLFSLAGANMTVATPTLLALFGGSQVVKTLKEILVKDRD